MHFRRYQEWEPEILHNQGDILGVTRGGVSEDIRLRPSEALVDLDDQGDARFNGSVGALPAVCTTEPDIAFLIRVGSGRWIGNAVVLR